MFSIHPLKAYPRNDTGVSPVRSSLQLRGQHRNCLHVGPRSRQPFSPAAAYLHGKAQFRHSICRLAMWLLHLLPFQRLTNEPESPQPRSLQSITRTELCLEWGCLLRAHWCCPALQKTPNCCTLLPSPAPHARARELLRQSFQPCAKGSVQLPPPRAWECTHPCP